MTAQKPVPSPKKLPSQIKQLVNKGNYVIAMKELSQSKGISLEDAKAWVDAYEESQKKPNQQVQTDHASAQGADTFQHLSASVTHAIEREGVSARVIPKWVRVLQAIILVVLLACLFYLIF